MQDFWDVKVIEIDAIHLYMYKNEQNLVNFPVRITFVIFILSESESESDFFVVDCRLQACIQGKNQSDPCRKLVYKGKNQSDPVIFIHFHTAAGCFAWGHPQKTKNDCWCFCQFQSLSLPKNLAWGHP